MNAINPEKLQVIEKYNKKLPGGRWEERERRATITVGVLDRYRWENKKAILAGGVETIIALTLNTLNNYQFVPLYKIGDSSEWTSTPGLKSYGRYDQARDWLSKQLEQYEE